MLLSIPVLSGSVKQIIWAHNIRNKVLDKVEALVNDKGGADAFFERLNQLSGRELDRMAHRNVSEVCQDEMYLTAFVLRWRSAPWWIRNHFKFGV